jgi:hypothetical protein
VPRADGKAAASDDAGLPTSPRLSHAALFVSVTQAMVQIGPRGAVLDLAGS